MAILDTELERYAAEAARREESVNSKASFLAVTSGVVIAAMVAVSWNIGQILVVVGLCLAVVAVIAAAWALRPTSSPGIAPRTLLDRYLDTTLQNARIHQQLIQRKTANATERETALKRRSLSVTVGYVLLVGALTLFAVAFSLHTLT